MVGLVGGPFVQTFGEPDDPQFKPDSLRGPRGFPGEATPEFLAKVAEAVAASQAALEALALAESARQAAEAALAAAQDAISTAVAQVTGAGEDAVAAAQQAVIDAAAIRDSVTQLRMGNVDPNPGQPGLWVQTGLGANGTDFTIWIEDGQ